MKNKEITEEDGNLTVKGNGNHRRKNVIRLTVKCFYINLNRKAGDRLDSGWSF